MFIEVFTYLVRFDIGLEMGAEAIFTCSVLRICYHPATWRFRRTR